MKNFIYIVLWTSIFSIQAFGQRTQAFEFDGEFEDFDFEEFAADTEQSQDKRSDKKREDLSDLSDEDLDSLFDDFDEENLSFEDFDKEPPVAQEPSFPAESLDSADDFAPFREDGDTFTDAPFQPLPEPPTKPEERSESLEEFVAPAPSPPQQWSSAGESPDYNFEARFYNIYMNFHKQKTPVSDWQALLGNRESEVYDIQSGDTLWGISETFFGDGNYWPKIWSVNRDITNPHLIQRGNVVQFMLGTQDDAPAFTISEAGELVQASVVAGDGGSLDAYGVVIPPPQQPIRPVLKRLPPSLPTWQEAPTSDKYDELGFEYQPRPLLNMSHVTYLTAYVTETETQGIGQVVEVETGGEIASQFQYVYVSLPQGSHRSGEKLLIVRNMGELKKSNPSVKMPVRAYHVDVLGELELKDSVPGNNKEDLFRALVTRSFSAIPVGSEIVRSNLPAFDFRAEGTAGQVSAQIVGGPLHARRQIFGSRSIVFLNRGAEDGMREGQVFGVLPNQKLRNPKSTFSTGHHSIGQLKVIRTSSRFSTAVVTQSSEAILAGDFTGPLKVGRLDDGFSMEQPGDGFGDFDFGEDINFNDNDDFNEFDGFDEFDSFDDF